LLPAASVAIVFELNKKLGYICGSSVEEVAKENAHAQTEFPAAWETANSSHAKTF
jgi:hypothetical protein